MYKKIIFKKIIIPQIFEFELKLNHWKKESKIHCNYKITKNKKIRNHNHIEYPRLIEAFQGIFVNYHLKHFSNNNWINLHRHRIRRISYYSFVIDPVICICLHTSTHILIIIYFVTGANLICDDMWKWNKLMSFDLK